MGDTGYLTDFSMDSEYNSDTLSEPRECLLRASATPSRVRVLQEGHRGFSRLVFDLPPNPSIDHLVPVILLEYDGYLREDGVQATSEVSEDTATTIVNVSSGDYIGALRGPGDRFEDEGCRAMPALKGRVGRLQRQALSRLCPPCSRPLTLPLGTPFLGIITIPISI